MEVGTPILFNLGAAQLGPWLGGEQAPALGSSQLDAGRRGTNRDAVPEGDPEDSPLGADHQPRDPTGRWRRQATRVRGEPQRPSGTREDPCFLGPGGLRERSHQRCPQASCHRLILPEQAVRALPGANPSPQAWASLPPSQVPAMSSHTHPWAVASKCEGRLSPGGGWAHSTEPRGLGQEPLGLWLGCAHCRLLSAQPGLAGSTRAVRSSGQRRPANSGDSAACVQSCERSRGADSC